MALVERKLLVFSYLIGAFACRPTMIDVFVPHLPQGLAATHQFEANQEKEVEVACVEAICNSVRVDIDYAQCPINIGSL